MLDASFCYCTNVHPGRTVREILAQLDEHAIRVRDEVRPGGALGIGLWLSESCVREVLGQPDGVERLRQALDERRLRVLTLNGFPQKDFHAHVVKHDVYRPSWADPSRLAHTLELAEVLAALLPDGGRGSISTLPLGWRGDGVGVPACAGQLVALARELAEILERTGRWISVDLEPEPGCELDLSEHVVRLFENELLARGDEGAIRAHIGACHDICHAAVMGEGQEEALRRYHDFGIFVNKVQVSSAVRVGASGLGELGRFVEERYLHQTAVRSAAGREFFDDLPAALDGIRDMRDVEEARVHFHVPIDRAALDDDGLVLTTSEEIPPAIATARELFPDAVFEVETYSWGLLPREMRPASLAAGISAEIRHLDRILAGAAR